MSAAAGDPGDVLAHVEQRIATARTTAAAAVDRVDALIELRSRALAIAHRVGVTQISAEQLWAAIETEHERARLAALIDRALPRDPNHHDDEWSTRA